MLLPSGPRGNKSSRVEELDFPERHLARAAEGWLELGNPAEAARELAGLRRATRRHPDVLELRWRIHAARRQWKLALRVATAVVSAAPQRPSGWIHRSYTLHELKRTAEAMANLLPALDRFPKEPIIPYNLACYACQLGELEIAATQLRRAMKLLGRDQVREMALHDADLEPLREFLAGL